MEYIINFDIENKDGNLLEKLIHKARMIIEKDNDIKASALVNKCDYASNIMSLLLDEENIDYSIKNTVDILGNDVLGHQFVVVYLDDNSYIVDLTYLQFFIKDRCQANLFKEVEGVTIISPDPGYYYVDNKDMMDVAMSILQRGYVKLDEKSAKAYLDSFYLTRRGRRFDIDIKASTYLNALNMKDKNKVK